ncbi:OPT family oligopeptide transporter [Coprothermobacter platensis]|uniref:OPT family oligopeptide transporter n=1 Tax=Coprothermobacter platensis TaxID=108819 RepID=UPI000360C6D2|nr:oligopeptide transporter, OPT family [Coprothermobacter platensis]
MAKRGLPDGAYGLKEGQTYVPYIPSEQALPEFTVVSVLLGAFLSILFGAANAYLGLRVGMTISVSISASVIAIAVSKALGRKNAILENNMVQTIASAGDGMAAGAIFTLPALFMWGLNPNPWVMGLITLVGGTIGTLLMIPLRRYLVVSQHGILPYPESIASAEVLVAGEEGGTGAYYMAMGGLVGFIYKYLGDGMNLFSTEVGWTIPGIKNAAIGLDVLPSLLGIGFIVGPKISSYMFAGAVFGWIMLIPMITFFGQSVASPIFPSTVPLSQMSYGDIWSSYLKYMGAGAMLCGGFISLIQELPTMFKSFREALKGFGGKANGKVSRIDADLNPMIMIGGIVVAIIVSVFIPQMHMGWLGALLAAIFGFFFVTVSSRLVGLIGSSNNPVSGMTIATVLITALIMKATGWTGTTGMVAALAVGAIVCTAAAVAGDVVQDTKVGYLVGGTPWRIEAGMMIGVVASAAVIGFILTLLNQAWGFGTSYIAAPQATLMKMIIEGVFSADLPWVLVIIGVVFAIVLAILEIPIMPVALGLYLPIYLSTPLMVGGLVRAFYDRATKKNPEAQKRGTETGVLYSSGLIAGEAIMGLVLAFCAYFNVHVALFKEPLWPSWASLGMFALITVSLVYYISRKPKNGADN